MRKKEIPPLSDEQRDFMEDFYAQHKELMYRTAKRLCNKPEEIGDLLQECLLCLMRNVSTLMSLDRCKSAAYVSIALKRLYINSASKARKEQLLSLNREEVCELVEQSSSIEHLPLDADVRLDALQILQSLTPKDAILLELWYIEGCSAERLAEQMCCKPDSIRMLLCRVRQRAIAVLNEENGGNIRAKRQPRNATSGI